MLTTFLSKSSHRIHKDCRKGIQEDIKSLNENVNEIDYKLKQRNSSIFDLNEIEMELTGIFVQINSYMIFAETDLDKILERPQEGLSKQQTKFYDDANKQIIELREICKSMVDKETDHEKILKQQKEEFQKQLKESHEEIMKKIESLGIYLLFSTISYPIDLSFIF